MDAVTLSAGASATDAGRPVIAYCVTPDDAKALVKEVIGDAAGRHVALDIETAPIAVDADRLRALLVELAAAMGRLKAAKKAKALLSEIEALAAEAKLLETRAKYAGSAGLDPYRSRIRLVQLYGGGRRVAVIDVFRACEGALALLNGLDVVIHSAAFELEHLEARGVELGEIHCTMQAARLTLGERATRLEIVAKVYLDIDLNKDLQTSDWSALHLTRAQLEYAADDVVAVWGIAERIFPALSLQTPAYEIQIAATPAAARMKHRGFKLDLAAHAELIAGLKMKRIAACEAYKSACIDDGQPDLAAKVPATPAEKQAALTAILTSQELERWKRTPKSGALSTARNDLRRASHYPPILALVELSKIDKILIAFGPTLAELVSPVTGRIHASYLIAATASGRAACSKPNLQQAPRDKAFRALFKAAEGYLLVGADYASMELRATAHISRDHRMTEAFGNGEDLHRLTAAAIAGKRPEEVTDEERMLARMGAALDLETRAPASKTVEALKELVNARNALIKDRVAALNRQAIAVSPLIALQVTGGKALPAEILDQILERTDGVPLFVEELTRTMLESGLMTDAGDRYELARPLPPLAIPENLHDSLMARLDRLATVKELAQIGAVIGREFSHELLAAVADRPQEQLENGLDQLVASELVFRRGSPPEATYNFKHALVKDAAYQSLLKSRRQQLHARLAHVFEERFPAVVETQPELLAYHLTEAGLDERAADAWARAGRTALGLSAMREAANSLSRAVGLLRGMPSSPDRQRLELELLGALGVALTNTLGPASSEAQAAHERADQLSQELGDRKGRFRARWNLWRVYNVRAEF